MMYVIIVVAALVANLVGFLWYSKFLFGTEWKALMNIPDKKRMIKTSTINFVLDLATAFCRGAALYSFGGFYSIGNAALTGLILWVGFMLPLSVGGFLWEGKSLKLVAINAGYRLVALFVMIAIFFFAVRIIG